MPNVKTQMSNEIQMIKSPLHSLPLPRGDCVIIASGGEGQSGSKALECGSFRLWEIADCME
jgi:hypothetical protein